LTPDNPEKVLQILSVKDELSMVNLRKEIGMMNLNSFQKLIDQMEKKGIVSTRTDGRERLVRLSDPRPPIDYFIKNYPKRLQYYKKTLAKESKALLNNLPIVSEKLPLIKVKVKEPTWEYDKKTNMHRPTGKPQEVDKYTFKARPTAEKQLAKILDLLYNLYQESSSLNFAKSIIDNPRLINTYQNRSEKMIKEITDNISNTLLKKDINSLPYVNFRLSNVLSGLIFKYTLEKEMKES